MRTHTIVALVADGPFTTTMLQTRGLQQ